MPRYTPNFRSRFRFWFDSTLNKGPVAQIFWLGVFAIFIVLLAAVVVTVLQIDPDDRNIGFLEALWVSLMRTLDPGNLNGDLGWAFRFVMLLVTTVGLLIVSTLIGIINSGISQTLEDLRKGKTFVPAQNHILILGWSPMIFSLLKRLAAANRFRQKTYIVILADKDKIEMEDEINTKVKSFPNIVIVCRSGNQLDVSDLEMVNPHEARTILVLAPEEDLHDVQAMKTVMALVKSHERKTEKYHIVVEIRDKDNLDIIRMIGEDEIIPVVMEDLFSTMTVQSSLQSGLSEVYNEILDLNEFDLLYFRDPSFTHKTFSEILLHCKDGCPIGIRKPDGEIILNPDKTTQLAENDSLICLHHSHCLPTWEKEIQVEETRVSNKVSYTPKPQHTLILGWNSKSKGIIKELDSYFIKGSEILVVADVPSLEAQIEEISATLKNQKLSCISGNIRSKVLLESIRLERFDHLILLCYDHMDIQSADALTLITLLHLRHIVDKANHGFTVVSEILDIRNRNLAEVTKADDYIVSDHLIGMVMAQLAGNIELNKIFDDLLTPGGTELYLRPVEDYLTPGGPVSIRTMVESVSRKGQTFIGYRIDEWSDNAEKRYGIILNPDKNLQVEFSCKDKVILIDTIV
ncbi:MAG TPA: hypothetical protein VNB90_15400 [Cytophagaceae bacterium]|nr:hypothetical protein [Cytophagaceae bacterium]